MEWPGGSKRLCAHHTGVTSPPWSPVAIKSHCCFLAFNLLVNGRGQQAGKRRRKGSRALREAGLGPLHRNSPQETGCVCRIGLIGPDAIGMKKYYLWAKIARLELNHLHREHLGFLKGGKWRHENALEQVFFCFHFTSGIENENHILCKGKA